MKEGRDPGSGEGNCAGEDGDVAGYEELDGAAT